MGVVGRSVPRLEDRPLVTGRGRFAADVSFPHMLHMRVVRSTHRAWPHRVDRRRRGAGAARASQRSGPSADVADIPPIDFRLTRIEGLEPYRQPILAQRARALCRRAGRGGVRRRSLSRRGRRRSGRARDRGTAGHARRRRGAGRVRARPLDRAGDRAQKATATSTRRSATRMPWSSSTLAVGRHSGVPLETRGAIARYDAGRDVLELHGAAKVPHWNRDQHRPHARAASPSTRASVRGPCRRRLRHPRRALSRGRAGLRRRAAAAAGRSNGSRTGASI